MYYFKESIKPNTWVFMPHFLTTSCKNVNYDRATLEILNNSIYSIFYKTIGLIKVDFVQACFGSQRLIIVSQMFDTVISDAKLMNLNKSFRITTSSGFSKLRIFSFLSLIIKCV